MIYGLTNAAGDGTNDDSSENETAFSDHFLTTLNKAFGGVVGPEIIQAYDQFGKHVVDFLGHTLPWGSAGRVAIQNFRCATPCVYFIGGEEGAIKIGVSIGPLERLATMQMGSPIPLRILALTTGGYAVEREYHARFEDFRSHGEWFHRDAKLLAEIARINSADI